MTAYATRTSRPVTPASRTAWSSSGARGVLRRSSGAVPDSSRDRSSSWATSRPSRRVCSTAVSSVARSGSVTPSARFSSTACRAAIGVRSSWLTSATSRRRSASTAARSVAIDVKALASSPTSSRAVTWTRRLQSPRAIARAAAAISRSGEVMPWATSCTSARDSRAASAHRLTGRTSSASPTSLSSRVIATASRMTMPNLTLMLRIRSSGLTRRTHPARSRRRARCGPGRRRACAAATGRGCRPSWCRRGPSPTRRTAAGRG